MQNKVYLCSPKHDDMMIKTLKVVYYLTSGTLFCITSQILVILYILVCWVVITLKRADKSFKVPGCIDRLAIHEGRYRKTPKNFDN